jgi:thioredoxin 1
MSTGQIILLIVVALFIGLIVYNQQRMKKMPSIENNDRIVVLSNKNFNPVTKSGLVLVDFWAAWCGPCKMMAPVLNEVAEEAGDSVTIAKLNVDHNPDLSQRFKIRSIPTLILFKDGKEIERYMGVKPKRFWLQELKKHQ